MASFLIEGGHRSTGSITPQGAKNEALQVICATLLTSEPVTIHNIPLILDIINLIQLMKDMGVEVTDDKNDPHTKTFNARSLDPQYLESEEFFKKCAKLRGSVMFLGPLIARIGHVYYAKPGGDKIGRRRLDTHFIGISNLGAKLIYDNERKAYLLQRFQPLKGTYMLLDEASVTGAANIIMAAVTAQGTTTIYNAACEPYIQQLCLVLNNMGARISGLASNLLTLKVSRCCMEQNTPFSLTCLKLAHSLEWRQ